jgi:hypothetical protein
MWGYQIFQQIGVMLCGKRQPLKVQNANLVGGPASELKQH